MEASTRPARPEATLLAGVRRVCVGSTNVPKLEGVRQAFGPYLPDAVPALRGEPIGPLFDAFFARAHTTQVSEPSALSVGNGGRLTLGVLPRADYTRQAVLCALVRFLHPRFYFREGAD